jgi:acetyl-CoA C-acetyltransferase
LPEAPQRVTFVSDVSAGGEQEEETMSIKGRGYIVGAYEHPTRKAPDKSVAQLHAECAAGALADAGLTKQDIDGYICAGDAPGHGPDRHDRLHEPASLRYFDSTDVGGSSYIAHVAHAHAGDRHGQVPAWR